MELLKKQNMLITVKHLLFAVSKSALNENDILAQIIYFNYRVKKKNHPIKTVLMRHPNVSDTCVFLFT